MTTQCNRGCGPGVSPHHSPCREGLLRDSGRGWAGQRGRQVPGGRSGGLGFHQERRREAEGTSLTALLTCLVLEFSRSHFQTPVGHRYQKVHEAKPWVTGEGTLDCRPTEEGCRPFAGLSS